MTSQSELSTPPELIVIVDPNAAIRVKGGRVTSLKEIDVTALQEVLNSEEAVMNPLYGVSEEWFRRRSDGYAPLMGVGQRLDLSIFYKITCHQDKLSRVADRLRNLPMIQSAYLKPHVQPSVARPERILNEPAVRTRTQDFTGLQEYLNAAVEGIDARFAWEKQGGMGADVRIIDVEGGWVFSHEDLLENGGCCVGGVPVSSLEWTTHGTAVLGVLGGDHNRFGIAGICPAADVNTISVFDNVHGDPSCEWGASAAIRLAADLLRPGDIILLELHEPGPAFCFEKRDDQLGYIPVEWWPCNLAAIQYATYCRGVIVVEAGGNGRENLEKQIYDENPAKPHGPFPSWWRNPFLRDPIDSGAILVGAGAPPDGIHGSTFGTDRSRLDYSNFGCAIDTQGWGEEVATSGGDNSLTPLISDENRQYTQTFRGTSSASAMVTGAIACLQGIMRAKGKTMTPEQVRELLQKNDLGSTQQDGDFAPASQRIGPRPDLRKLINHLCPPSFLERVLLRLRLTS